MIVDLRPDSPTLLQHVGVELTEDNRRHATGAEELRPRLPHADGRRRGDLPGVASSTRPAAERGLRYDDPAFGIEWPMAVTIMSDKDAHWPLSVAKRVLA